MAASAAAETRLLSPGMQQIPNQMRAQQGTPLGKLALSNFINVFLGMITSIQLDMFLNFFFL